MSDYDRRQKAVSIDIKLDSVSVEERENLIPLIEARMKDAEQRLMRSISEDLYSGSIDASSYTPVPVPKWDRFKNWLYRKTWKIRGCYNVIRYDSCLGCESSEDY